MPLCVLECVCFSLRTPRPICLLCPLMLAQGGLCPPPTSSLPHTLIRPHLVAFFFPRQGSDDKNPRLLPPRPPPHTRTRLPLTFLFNPPLPFFLQKLPDTHAHLLPFPAPRLSRGNIRMRPNEDKLIPISRKQPEGRQEKVATLPPAR